MKQHLLITGAVIAALSLAALAADEAAQAFWGITDPLAQPSFNRWTLAEEQAMERYERAVTAASQKLREELDVVQQRLVGAGKLEEAIKVKAAIDDLNQGKGPVAVEGAEPASEAQLLRPAIARALHRTSWRHWEGWTITFDARDMSSSSVHQAAGTWSVVAKDTIRSSHNRRNSQGYLLKIDSTGTRLVEEDGKAWTLIAK